MLSSLGFFASEIEGLAGRLPACVCSCISNGGEGIVGVVETNIQSILCEKAVKLVGAADNQFVRENPKSTTPLASPPFPGKSWLRA